ncbi:sulfurtransferase [Neolewinella persica]|uniref:sulfurtransferase n=1 Tax=Neolewinella persica TaxID=70998 RepID=UPI0003784A12|nr:sulfurtransferase [Neolewinella persica]
MHTTIISVAELANLPAADRLIFDCRHDLFAPQFGFEAYLAGHLPGAYYLHLDRDLSGEIIPGKTGRHPLPDMADFARRISTYGLKPTTQVICYDDKGGGIAARLWWMLRALDHEAVAVLDGGFQAWEAAGKPLETGERAPAFPEVSAASHLASKPIFRTCDRAQVDNMRKNPAQRLIDSRTAPRYRGEEEPIDPVAGHISGAINLPWPENLHDGKFKSREKLKIRFAELVDEADQNVFYCGSGVTACHNILAYTYAFGEMPGLYPGSWSEWLTSLRPEA